MHEELTALAERIYREAADLKAGGVSKRAILVHLVRSGLKYKDAKMVVSSLSGFMASELYTRS